MAPGKLPLPRLSNNNNKEEKKEEPNGYINTILSKPMDSQTKQKKSGLKFVDE